MSYDVKLILAYMFGCMIGLPIGTLLVISYIDGERWMMALLSFFRSLFRFPFWLVKQLLKRTGKGIEV